MELVRKLKSGDMIKVGFQSNFADVKLGWVYFTGTLDAAISGAELASGANPERIYVVEPTGEFADDPNLTDKKFPGNPTMSYRSRHPLRIIAEVTDWQPHSSEQVQKMKRGLGRLEDPEAHIID